MKNILKSFSYLKNYRFLVIINILITLVVSILEVFSLIAVVPLLEILFSKNEVKQLTKPEAFSVFPLSEIKESAQLNFNYFSNQMMLEHGKEKLLIAICIGIMLIFIIKNIFAYLDKVIDRYIRINVVRDLRSDMYKKVLELPITYFNNEKRGDILTKYSLDIEQIRSLCVAGYTMLIKRPIHIIMFILAMFTISKELTLFVFVLIPVLGLVINRISKTLKKKTHTFQNKTANLLAKLDETMFGAKIVKSFTAEDFLEEKFNTANQDVNRANKSIERRRVASSPISEILGVGLVMLVMWYGGKLILSENSMLTGELFIAFIVIFARLIEPIKTLVDEYSSLVIGVASAERVDAFLSHKSEFSNTDKTPISFNSNITFNTVDFAYPNTEKKVIQNFSLNLPKGTTTALVGQSGAGKSTIADLLPRFYDVTNGEILLDGQPITNYSKYQLRSLLSYVSQEAILFNDTIFNNIAFGLENISEQDVINAAKAANAHEFIAKLENGYHTNVGERGGKLSGGQKQRITIARAILKNSPILILDEATSALDTESEKLVQDAIDKLLQNRTALVIAHRLSTIKNADQICVMQDGKIIEQGTHNELIAQDGQYKVLTDMQAI